MKCPVCKKRSDDTTQFVRVWKADMNKKNRVVERSGGKIIYVCPDCEPKLPFATVPAEQNEGLIGRTMKKLQKREEAKSKKKDGVQ